MCNLSSQKQAHGGVAASPADQAPQTSVESPHSLGGWQGFHGCW